MNKYGSIFQGKNKVGVLLYFLEKSTEASKIYQLTLEEYSEFSVNECAKIGEKINNLTRYFNGSYGFVLKSKVKKSISKVDLTEEDSEELTLALENLISEERILFQFDFEKEELNQNPLMQLTFACAIKKEKNKLFPGYNSISIPNSTPK